jgi:8-oxo-dGTP pyrophosphatase MutT (NUDIX family)
MSRIKRAYGIICCRINKERGFETILIKKTITYHFFEFVSGNYRKHDDMHLQKLFNNMTFYEKMDILSMKFNFMWYRIYHSLPDPKTSSRLSTNYTRQKSKFETTFINDGGIRLRRLISNTTNAETLWEIPKGRRKEHMKEGELAAAIREFSEETGVSDQKYQILTRLPPYIETYSDFGVTYQNIYYYAEAIGDWVPDIRFNDTTQTSEVAGIGWCNSYDIKNLKLDNTTHHRLIKMFALINKKYKNYKKNISILIS